MNGYLLGVSGHERPFLFHKFRRLENPRIQFLFSSAWRRRPISSSRSSFRAHETMLEHAILDTEETSSEHTSSGGINDDEKKDRGLADVSHIDTEKNLRSV